MALQIGRYTSGQELGQAFLPKFKKIYTISNPKVANFKRPKKSLEILSKTCD